MALLTLRIGNDVSYVMRITDAIHFAWQVQYFGEGCFTGEADQSCDSFCLAGAVLCDLER